VVLRCEAGRGDPYTRPRTATDDRWFNLPYDYWPQGWREKLNLPGKAMLLIALSLTTNFPCFYLPGEGTLFSGDVLFAGNIGRVDLPGADPDAMERSLARLASLPAETLVNPCHGATTIAGELPWLRGFRFS